MLALFDWFEQAIPFLSWKWWLMLIIFLGLIGFLIWNRKRQK